MNSLFKILFLLILFFLISCDFRVPQEWETPEWQFDLNIPLINEEYSMSAIASESNDITISNPDSLDFSLYVNERIIEEGQVETDESFFIIDGSNLEFSLENLIEIPNPNPMPAIPNISQNINLQNILGIDIEQGSCIPSNPTGFENGFDTTIVFDIGNFCENIGDVECLDQINWLKIASGNNTFEVNNNLPFLINELEFNLNSNVGSIIDDNFINIDGLTSSNTPLSDSTLGCDISGSLSLNISSPLQSSSNSSNCNFCEDLGNYYYNEECYIPIILDENSCSQIEIEGQNATWFDGECRFILDSVNDSFTCQTLDFTWDPNTNQCYELITLDAETCGSNGWNWIESQNGCYLACTEQQECCESISGIWDNGNCLNAPSFEGIRITDNPNNLNLNISNQMIIDSFSSLRALIRDCDIPTSYSIPLVSNPNMTLVEGYISNNNDLDTNRIQIDLTNNLFTEIYADINTPNLVDSLGNVLIVDTGNISVGDTFQDIVLSNYIIKDDSGNAIDSLKMNFQINIPDGLADIEFDRAYGLTGNGVSIKTTELEALKVNLNEFSSPGINMGSVPSGMDGFDIPFMTFNLNMYNQISANMKLYLDLYGINETDTLLIHVEPDIKFSDSLNPYIDTDSLQISFYKDTMSVKHVGNNLESLESTKTQIESKITDLFKYDIIEVNGYAIMDGDATLLPNKSLWGDIEVIIEPLTIIIEDSDLFSFTSDKYTELSAMDRITASKIDSSLISATVDMNLNNQLPFAGDLLLYISNSDQKFPFCIDSLVTGTVDQQEVTDTCKSILSNQIGCQTLVIDTLGSYVKNLDCISSDSIFYYNRIAEMNFISPSLDQWGNVLDSSLTSQSIVMDDEVFYFTKDNIQYIIPRFIFSSDLDTITLQPNNLLKVNSAISFKLLNTGLIE